MAVDDRVVEDSVKSVVIVTGSVVVVAVVLVLIVTGAWHGDGGWWTIGCGH